MESEVSDWSNYQTVWSARPVQAWTVRGLKKWLYFAFIGGENKVWYSNGTEAYCYDEHFTSSFVDKLQLFLLYSFLLDYISLKSMIMKLFSKANLVTYGLLYFQQLLLPLLRKYTEERQMQGAFSCLKKLNS